MVSGGAGDNCINVWDMENCSLKESLSGHGDYIHEVAVKSPNEIVSASEDGSVRFWDIRAGRGCIHVLNPHATECARPSLGKWVGCVVVDKDWLVCGGGPALGLWHLGSMSLAKTMSSGDSESHSAMFYEDKIITGGSKSKLCHWNFQGELLSEIPISPLCVYSVAVNDKSEQFKVLTASGSSSKLDVFINPGYKAFSLETFPMEKNILLS